MEGFANVTNRAFFTILRLHKSERQRVTSVTINNAEDDNNNLTHDEPGTTQNAYLDCFHPHHPWEAGTVLTCAFQMRKLRLTERVPHSRASLHNPLRPVLSFDKLENRPGEVMWPEFLFIFCHQAVLSAVC